MSAGRAAGALVLAAVLAVPAACDDGGDREADPGPGPTTTTTGAAPATSASSGTTSTTAAPADDTSAAVFPTGEGATGYPDPVAAATAFAEEFAGFQAPVVGGFQAGDARSGEVEVRPRPDGPVTTVFLRRLTADDTWWVLGSAYDGLRLRRPRALGTVSSPQRLAGRARAYEGTVLVEVRQDGRREPLGSTFVTGSGDGTLGPFEGEVAFEAPSAEAGALVLFTRSAEDDRVWEAAVVRVRFAP